MYEDSRACRACAHRERVEVFSLDHMPLADGLISQEQLDEQEPRFPLTLLFCPNCSLLQLRETVSPQLLFGDDYPYYSSLSDGWLTHCRKNALELIDSRRLDESSFVVEIASNDGYMLKNFQQRRIPVLGIDPAAGPAAAASESGISVMTEFLTRDLAEQLRAEGVRADVLLANNVLAHVADLPGFVESVGRLLKDDGVAVIEVPYAMDLIAHCEFDTIYHEHLCYFSVTALRSLFADRGLYLKDVRKLPTHGGSLRLYVERSDSPTDSVQRMLEAEREQGICRADYYRGFAQRVSNIRDDLLDMLQGFKRSGKRIAAYAAAAKGVTLLNAFGIGSGLLDFVVDRNRHKHGKYLPGVRLPIYDTPHLLETRPDYVLLLAWNHANEILRQQSDFRRQGGRFIVPIPSPQVV